MKFPNMKTLLITVGAGAVILGFIMKSGRDAVKNGAKAEDTVAGKLGLIA